MNPKKYLVGGAVRDLIIGNKPKDFDYVVVGASQQWMLDQGFKQVGAAFPVFLHQETGEEYAMARREKKISPGYQGFEFEFGPDVTLEEDLSRRDLTINSIAMNLETKEYTDPFNGVQDIKDGIIRHTSEAFAEDPLRVMRVARFAARYGFKIHHDTKFLCKKLVSSGELDALSADRIWGELEKLFSETHSSIGIHFLSSIGALDSKRLKGLITVHRFSKIKEDEEAKFTTFEKMYLHLNIVYHTKLTNVLSKADIERFRLPKDLVRQCKIVEALCIAVDLKCSSENNLHSQIVNIFDSFREEIRNDSIRAAFSFCKKVYPINKQHFLVKLDFVLKELLKLDFTEYVKTLQPSEIKDSVRTKKIETVIELLNVH